LTSNKGKARISRKYLLFVALFSWKNQVSCVLFDISHLDNVTVDYSTIINPCHSKSIIELSQKYNEIISLAAEKLGFLKSINQHSMGRKLNSLEKKSNHQLNSKENFSQLKC